MSMRLRDAAAGMSRDEVDDVVAALERKGEPWSSADGALAIPAPHVGRSGDGIGFRAACSTRRR